MRPEEVDLCDWRSVHKMIEQEDGQGLETTFERGRRCRSRGKEGEIELSI